MKKFIQNIIVFIVCFGLIALILIIPYIHADPYADFGKKQNYSWKYSFQLLGDISTKKLLNSTFRYNSFIFGSSRSVGLYACYLNKIIPNANFFHYGNWNESIGGIYNKLQLIDSLGYSIDNIVIYLDTDFTFRGKGKPHTLDHYLISKQKKIDYLIRHFKDFYKTPSLDKVKILFRYNINGEIYPNWDSDLLTNDSNHNCDNQNIISNYSKIKNDNRYRHKIDSLKSIGFLYQRPISQQFKKISQISDSEKLILSKIKNLINQHSTNHYVIITPLYSQKKFNQKDQGILHEVFGDCLYDFSGINMYTNNIYNYPDKSHFQPYISKIMIDSVLKHSSTTRNYSH